MATNSFINFFDKAEGESTQKGMEKWVEIQGWDWDVEAESSWTKGGGASVGKPNPGKLNFQHFYDTASNVILGYICTGKAFPKIELKMQKASSRENPEAFFPCFLIAHCLYDDSTFAGNDLPDPVTIVCTGCSYNSYFLCVRVNNDNRPGGKCVC